jgi:hypothetical protein
MTYNSLKRSHLRPLYPFALETTDVEGRVEKKNGSKQAMVLRERRRR